MKIVHIAPSAPYNDYWGYQENLLPKYQKKAGHDVTVITTNTMHRDGKITEIDPDDYVLNDGVRVIRLKRERYAFPILTSMCAKLKTFPYLKELKPDFIFFHGLVSTTIFDAVKYKKRINPKCVIVQDNHTDDNNTHTDRFLKDLLVRLFYRTIHRFTNRYVSRVYGVTPWRKRYAEDYFKVDPSKTDILIMGADDEKIDFTNRERIRSGIRRQHQITDDDFLVVTGGKIDKNKHIDLLMEACGDLSGVKLMVFGQVLEDVKARFEQLLRENENIVYVGWIPADTVYNYFFAADLVVFPGGHSVLWEQACASKTPCLFEKWDGMQHVDNGGNSRFIDAVSVENIRKDIQLLLLTEDYKAMKAAAESEKTDIYLYSRIAKKSIECVE
ncbi:MAG: glycosyltransferase family 4 protein [Clostridia bacterium]|nr:glycosyltransferase family 4 protein [Clostridia bacterium]